MCQNGGFVSSRSNQAVVVFPFGLRLFGFLLHSSIIRCNNAPRVRCVTVTKFHGIMVEDFMECVVPGKVLFDEL